MRLLFPRWGVTRAAFLAACFSTALAAAPVRYTLSLANPEKHYIGVTMKLDAGDASYLDVRLPVWNGLYQVYDFAQYVSQVQTGPDARVEKLEKSAWRVTPKAPPEGKAPEIEVRYRIFADRAGPFGAQLDSRHAFINPAQVLMYTDEHRHLPVELRFTELAPRWKVAAALAERDGVWQARSYDHLADSPIEISEFDEATFAAGGGSYRIVVHAARDAYSMAALRRTVERIVTFQTALMQDVPFSRFTFLYHFGEGRGGGMEHADSAAMDMPPQRNQRDAARLASLTAHEFFHLWNVKRIRPQSLEPVDYSREQSTRALWFSEGFTDTYASYTLLRSGLMSRERFLEELGRDIRELESRPARLHQSLEESSLDAWLEKYGYYNSPERSISYYRKGKLVGILLDLAIRQATENRRSLDEVLRYLNERYGRAGRFFDERRDIQAAAEAVAGQPLGSLFEDLVRSARPVPYESFLQYAGLGLRQEQRPVALLGFHASRGTGRNYTIQSVARRGPADKAGVRPGDEPLAVNGQELRSPFSEIAEAITPGSKVKLRLRRDSREFEVRYKTGRATEEVTVVAPLPRPSPLQEKVREGWLSGKTE